ncbi:Major egg antigen [Schistosoma japonicum]|nr:Major egg antigen [Schistosoma japonicum]
MSGTHQNHAVSIPVNREQCSFPRHRHELLQNVGKASKSGQLGSVVPYTEDWPSSVSNWIESSLKSWDKEMERLRRGMFALLPMDRFMVGIPHDPLGMMHEMDRHIEELQNGMGLSAVAPLGSTSDYLKDAYEVGDDGKVHFKVRFDAQGFAPEDINVTSSDNRVTVHAKKETTTGGKKCSHEFCRMIQLPKSIENNQLKCRLTDDGVLMLEAPVKVGENKSLTMNESGQVGIQPKSASQIQAVPASQALTVKGCQGLTVLDDGAGGKKLHVEVQLDPVYRPEDLCVNIDSNRVVVSGRHYKQKTDARRKSSSFAEFSQSYSIPETVDPLTVSAQHHQKSVVIPINQESKTFEQHRREMLTGLQHRHKGRKRPKLSNTTHIDTWSDVIDNWVDSSWRSWDDEMHRLRRGMFALLPLDTFGQISSIPDPFDLMHRMEGEIEEIRNRIGMSKVPGVGALTDFLKDAYEVGEDGKVSDECYMCSSQTIYL